MQRELLSSKQLLGDGGVIPFAGSIRLGEHLGIHRDCRL